MTDRILLSRIAVYAYHGLHPEEEKLGQRFYVSLDCRLDLRPASLADDWKKTVSYDRLAKIVVDTATESRFSLIEALAEVIAAKILTTYVQIHTVTVRVEKPAAPIPHILEGVAIEIERKRGG